MSEIMLIFDLTLCLLAIWSIWIQIEGYRLNREIINKQLAYNARAENKQLAYNARAEWILNYSYLRCR